MDDAYQDTWITWMVLTLELNFPVLFTRLLHLFHSSRRLRTLICNGKWSSSSSSDALTRPMPPLPNLTYIPPSLETALHRLLPSAARTRYFSSESVRACVRAFLCPVHPSVGRFMGR